MNKEEGDPASPSQNNEVAEVTKQLEATTITNEEENTWNTPKKGRGKGKGKGKAEVSSDTVPSDTAPKKMYIMRGLPGSGKSTLAITLAGEAGISLSTDDYFMKNGKYVYDRNQIRKAHQWNQQRALVQIQKGVTPIVIDNTNMTSWEPKFYVTHGLNHGYQIEIAEPQTEWAKDPVVCSEKNSHGVPLDALYAMSSKYSAYTLEDIMGSK